jgi:hypothetical protein
MKHITTPYDGIESVEIPITSLTERKYYLPDLPQLKGKILNRIEFPMLVTNTPNNRVNISGGIRESYFTLITGNATVLNRIPSFVLTKMFFTGDTYHYPVPIDFLNIPIQDIERSYIEFSKTSSLALNQSILINFYYTLPKKPVKMVQTLASTMVLNSISEPSVTEKIYPVQIEIPTTSDLILKFPNDEFLKNKCITRIRFYNSILPLTEIGFNPRLKAPDNKTIISETVGKKTFLNLRLINGERITNLPANLINYEPYAICDILFNNIQVDWPRSTIKIANSTGLTAGEVIYLVFYYTEKTNKNDTNNRNIRRYRDR